MNLDDPKLTAYALGELSGEDKAKMEGEIAASPDAQKYMEELREFSGLLQKSYASEQEVEAGRSRNLMDIREDRWFWSIARPLAVAAILAVGAIVAGVIVFSHPQRASYLTRSSPVGATSPTLNLPLAAPSAATEVQGEFLAEDPGAIASSSPLSSSFTTGVHYRSLEAGVRPDKLAKESYAFGDGLATDTKSRQSITTERDAKGNFAGRVNTDLFKTPPATRGLAVGGERRADVGQLLAQTPSGPKAKSEIDRVAVTGSNIPTSEPTPTAFAQAMAAPAPAQSPWENSEELRAGGTIQGQSGSFNTAAYDHLVENPFLEAKSNPLSTFSIDVDTASYSNLRRFINQGQLPPRDAVRVEEMLNYFTYDYPQPNDGKPFSINLDSTSCPWDASHRLVRIGLKGREIAADKRGASNLVFLLDVSGSMTPAERLPLIKQSMRLLVEKLTENDRVAIVVYAGASGLALPSTTGDHKDQIISALENLQPGGSTNGAEGIGLAYKIAGDNFIKGGVNRVILATDGDFNVGVTSQGDLVRLIEEKAKTGVFLSVLGVGTDNLKDSTMQKLADKGNGNYAYLDSLDEARKVLVQQMNGTLVTIAKDVKIQVEFNPARVASYRLIGYEKRMLRKEDFNNDKVDAGEIGAGHTVTALYEVVPVGATDPTASAPPVDPLKYAAQSTPVPAPTGSNEMLTVKLRYKAPDGDKSELTERSLVDNETKFANASSDLKFAAAVAEFGMLLRDSEHKGNGSLGAVMEWAQEGKGADLNGYRQGFIELVRKAQSLGKG